MSKSSHQQKTAAAGSKKRKTAGINSRQIIIFSVLGIAVLGLLLPNILPLFTTKGPASLPALDNKENIPEPQFKKEGELQFISGKTGQVIRQIDIEKAETDMERQFGLMYRKSMADTVGMLFIFEQSSPQAFWMKNTYIPLDILFVDQNNNIIKIHENAMPHSENSLPSEGNAQYVVEVNGGFVNKYGVAPGDKISWK